MVSGHTEVERIHELKKLAILDSAPENNFDQLTWLASQVTQMPIAFIAFMDTNREWYKARKGFEMKECPRSLSLCNKMIETSKPLAYGNFDQHPELNDHILRKDPFDVRAYIGVPLITSNGYVIGSVCAADHKPIEVTEEKMTALKVIADQVIQILESRVPNTQSVRLQSLGLMTGEIMHELRNPITALSMRTYNLQRKVKKGELSSEQLSDGLAEIEYVCQRITKMAQSILRVIRGGQREHFETIYISSLVRDVCDFFSPRLRQFDIKLEIEGPADVSVNCRPTEIAQVITNLISNAIDAVAEMPQRRIKVRWFEESKWVSVSVIDSGNGVPKDIRDKIMQPFFTTKTSGSGTGLGLSISKNICTSHGGDLKLSTENPETEFIMILPIIPPGSDLPH